MSDVATDWELLLRGAVAGLLLLHLVQLAWPGARPAARAALALFTLSLLAYVFCQQADMLLRLPGPLALVALALCVSATAWMWLSARALFDDHFGFSPPLLATALAMVALGLAAHLPHWQSIVQGRPPELMPRLSALHAAAMLGFSFATLWEIWRGGRDDLVESRRAARRWVALGIALYAAVALIVELALRGHSVGRLLPALHIAGIGLVALGLALWIARHSLDAVLGLPVAAPQPPRPDSPAASADDMPAAPATGDGLPTATARSPGSPALVELDRLMRDEYLYRREGLTLAGLADTLGIGEAALRSQINQGLGFRNFNDFLHHHRLQEAATRLAAEDRPILSIALECGYGSIGPFNRAFRQRFGMTPSEYRGGLRLNRAPTTR